MIGRYMYKRIYIEMCGRRAGLQCTCARGDGDFRFQSTNSAFYSPSILPVAGIAVQISYGAAKYINRLFVKT